MFNSRKDKDRHGFEAVPAVIVADHTDTFGKRLGMMAVVLLVLFFAVGGYIRAAKNGDQLDRAARDRSNLSKVVERQSRLVVQLQQAIRDQNETLAKAGLARVIVPGDAKIVVIKPTPTPVPRPRSSGRIAPAPQKTAAPRATNKARATPKPSHAPSPRPKPTYVIPDPAGSLVCQLTGICPTAFKEKNDQSGSGVEQSALRRVEVSGAGGASSSWYSVLCSWGYLGIA